jgi:hypothetical protein
MATFTGRTSPTALAALAPSITNLAAAQRAKSQAAAGLMNTLGVQFEKQKEQAAKREKNEAALEIAKGLIADPAFRRQMPGVTDAAGLVKVAGAESVLDFGMKTQQADRLAQQSAAQIALTQKQIEQYDIDAKQREAEEASSKALTTLVGSIYGEGFTQEDLMTGLQGLSSSDAVRALNIYNERNPGEMLEQRTIGGRTFVYNTKTGATFDLGTGSELPEAYTEGLALIKEQFAEGTPEYNRAVQDLTDRTLGYDVTLGETAFGRQPADAGPFAPTEAETVLFSRLPDNIFTEDNMVDSEKLEAELAKMDFLSPEEVERMRRFAAQESVNRRRDAYLKTTEEEPEEQPGFLDRLFSTGRSRRSPRPQYIPTETDTNRIGQGSARRAGPTATEPEVIEPTIVSAPGRVAARRRSAPPAAVELPNERQVQKQELKARQAAFKNAKELARMELIEKYKGKDKKQILEELEKARLDKIMSMPKTSAQTPAQRKVHELLKNMFQMPSFVEQYGLDELPSEIAKFVRDMIPVTERERLRRERSNRNQSTVTPVE